MKKAKKKTLILQHMVVQCYQLHHSALHCSWIYLFIYHSTSEGKGSHFKKKAV